MAGERCGKDAPDTLASGLTVHNQDESVEDSWKYVQGVFEPDHSDRKYGEARVVEVGEKEND